MTLNVLQAAEVRKCGAVEDAVAALAKTLAGLNEAASNLERSIAPALTPQHAADGAQRAPDAPAPARSPLAHALNDLERQAASITSRLYTLADRVEL